MLQVTNVGLRFGDKELYKDVNLKFTKGNCYGIIGANGAGKTTFLKILAGDIEPNTGSVSITEKERMSVLRQDHFKYDEETVLDVVIMGHERLYQIMKENGILEATLGDLRLSITKAYTKQQLDAKRLKEEEPLLFKKYTKAVYVDESLKVTLKK